MNFTSKKGISVNQNKSNQNYNMGLQYQFGMNGLEKDYNKALFYCEKTSKENFKPAQEKVYYNQFPLSIYMFFIGILLIFLVVGIVTNNIWIVPSFPGIIYAAYTTFNLNNYWNKEGLTYKINIALLMVSYLILIPLAAVIPYLYGISWFPIIILLLIGIIIVGVGLIQLFDDRNKINTTIVLSGLFVVGVSIFGLSIDTPSQQFIIRDFENGVEIVRYRSNELDLVIPDTINNKPVLKIGKGAFLNTSIESIELPSSLRFIDDYAFSYARNLKDIDLRGNIQLGKGVFLYAVSLETVYLPTDMTVLPEEMLMGTFSLKELRLPDTLLSIENGALSYSGLNNIYLPPNLKNIGDNALRGTQITEITLPNHLENIGDYVLAENQALQNIQFSTNMSTIPKGTFQDTKDLTYIMIPKHIIEIHEAAFKNSEGLIEIILHDDLILIEDEAFMNTKSLESITIPSSINTINK
jgi:hypothetical protein